MYKNINVKLIKATKPPKKIFYGCIETPDYGPMYSAYYLEEKHLYICRFKFALKQAMDKFVNDLKKFCPQSKCVQDDKLTNLVFAKYITEQRETQEVFVIPSGTEFQMNVWSALLDIPYGEERTYGEVAAMIGKPKAARAVGNAVGSNNIAIFIPCHRVKASFNDKYKYGSGTDLKKRILLNEQKRK